MKKKPTKQEMYRLTDEQEAWVKRRSRKRKGGKFPPDELRANIKNGRCKWSNIPLLFDKESCSPKKDPPRTSHPLSASVDHLSPNTTDYGCAIVCHFLNDIKGQMPYYLFEALRKTKAWNAAMNRMQKQYKKTPHKEELIVASFANEQIPPPKGKR